MASCRAVHATIEQQTWSVCKQGLSQILPLCAVEELEFQPSMASFSLLDPLNRAKFSEATLQVHNEAFSSRTRVSGTAEFGACGRGISGGARLRAMLLAVLLQLDIPSGLKD